MTLGDLDQVIELDERSFGAGRGFFLKRRFELFPELSFVMLHRNKIAGFILGRGVKIGYQQVPGWWKDPWSIQRIC